MSFFVADRRRARPRPAVGRGPQARLRRRPGAQHRRHGRVLAEPARRPRRWRRRILDEIVVPTLRGMAAEGHPYRGFLYVGLMLTADGPKVIEFNARLGDPETQVVLPRIDEDLLPHLWYAADGTLESGRLPDARRPRTSASCWRRAAIPEQVRDGQADRRPRRSCRAARRARLPRRHGRARRPDRDRRRPRADRRRPAAPTSRKPAGARTRRSAHFVRAMHYRRDIGVRAVDSSQ